MNETRPPAVAGLFYPGQEPGLAREVAALMAAQASPDPGAPPKAIIAPHAGYAYSGGAAAAVFSTLAQARGTIERIVLLAPAHTMPLQGIAAPAATAFETPLGTMPIDRDALARAGKLPFVVESDAAHASEHAIEVELPSCRRCWTRLASCLSSSAEPAPKTWRSFCISSGAAKRR